MDPPMRLLKASVVFLTRTLSDPMRRKPAATAASFSRNFQSGEKRRKKQKSINKLSAKRCFTDMQYK